MKLYIKNWEFPKSQFSEDDITVRQLLTNSAGMPLENIDYVMRQKKIC